MAGNGQYDGWLDTVFRNNPPLETEVSEYIKEHLDELCREVVNKNSDSNK